MTRIYLIGRVMIESDHEVIESSAFPGRQGRLAFVYLVASARRVDRSHLAEILWRDSLPQTWDTSLSAIISKLRKLVDRSGLDGHQVIESVHGSYEFRPPPGTWIDLRYAINELDHAEGALRHGQAKEAWAGAAAASAILRRSFLPGESGDWLDEVRRNLHDLQVRAYDTLAGALLLDGQPDAALVPARQAVDLAPFRESSYGRLMECHIARGNRAEALRVYEDLSGLLRESLGVSPTPDIEALYEKALG